MRRPSILVLALCTACTGTTQLNASASAPRPAASQSLPPLYIHTRDVSLPDNYILRHEARFNVTSPDEARFHLRLVFASEEMADPGDWQVYLVDEAGRRIDPVAAEGERGRLALRWNLVPRESTFDYAALRLIPGRDVYEALSSYRFVAPGLVGAERQGLTLVARRGDYELRWAWSFQDGPIELDHHGPRPARYANSVVIPGPYSTVVERY
jgi:hypothetical protein